jgi:hypothetical protein
MSVISDDEKEDLNAISVLEGDVEITAIPTSSRDHTETPISHRIIFAPDAKGKHKEAKEAITTLPLTRTFSRASSSSAKDGDGKRVSRTYNIQPHTILPVGNAARLFSADFE